MGAPMQVDVVENRFLHGATPVAQAQGQGVAGGFYVGVGSHAVNRPSFCPVEPLNSSQLCCEVR